MENAVSVSNELNIPILYISTAGIFDGNKNLYDDWDIPNPLGHYARSKYMGEKYVSERSIRYLICRAGWMMGGGPKKDKKFINKIINQIVNGEKELFVVDDKDGTPTYTIDFAENVKKLLESEHWGLYNLVCEGESSRFEVAEEILKIIDRTDIKINKVSSDYFKDTYFADRPKSERLINKKLYLRNMNMMRNWKICLKEYIDDYYTEYLNIKK